MAKGRLGNVLRHLRGLAGPSADAAQGDGQLLRRFASGRDEAAFAELVRRHGGLVWAVCRSILGHEQDAEDAFQAAFLVLARRAGSVRRGDALAGWLYGVACRTALRARRSLAARARRERGATPGRPPEQPVSEAALRELQALLHEEVGRLPERCRAPFVLCCLEGRSRAEAAAQLGWKEGTVSGRVAEARDRLRQRLARRGVELPAALGLAALATRTAPAALAEAAVRGALGFAAGEAGAAPARAVRLADGVLRGLGGSRAKALLALALLLGVAASGVGLAGRQASEGQPTGGGPPAAEAPGDERRAGMDKYGDPLPAGALARLGTMRFHHEGNAESLAFSPDRKLLAASSEDGCLHLWDTATGREVRRLRASPKFPPFNHAPRQAVCFSPDGKRVAALGADGAGTLWDVATGTPVARFRVPADGGLLVPTPLHFAPDGHTLLAAWSEGGVGAPKSAAGVAVIDAASGRELRRFGPPRGAVHGLAVSPDGQTVALGMTNPPVQLWDVARGTLLRSLDGQKDSDVQGLAFSPDGKTLAWGGQGRVVLTDVAGGQEVGRLVTEKEVASSLAFTPDGKTLVSDAPDCKVRVWNVPSRKQRLELDGRMWVGSAVALAPDGSTVAQATTYSVIRLWDLATGRELFTDFAGHDGRVLAIAFSPDGRLLVSGDANQQVRLWDAATGKPLRALDAVGGTLAFAPDGRRFASASGNEPVRYDEPPDETVRVWDVDTGNEVFRLRHRGAFQIVRVAFTPDGAGLLSLEAQTADNGSRGSGALCRWDAGTGRHRRRMPLGEPHPRGAAFSPDGRTLAVGGAYEGKAALRILDVPSGREGPVLDTQPDLVPTAFSPDGRLLATQDWGPGRIPNGKSKDAARVWEVATGKEVLRLVGVGGLVFSPDGRLVAAGLGTPLDQPQDGPPRVGIWEVATGKQVQELSGFGSAVSALAFAPDGRRLASGLANGTVLVWDVSAAARAAQRPRDLAPGDLDRLWADLAGDDAARAWAAVFALAAAPEQAVAFLRPRLRPAAPCEPGRVRQLIADLDSDQFDTREAASRELEKLGSEAETELRQAQAAGPSPEAGRRLEALLAGVRLVRSPEVVRQLRAVAALEAAGTPEARDVLEGPAGGAPEARLTQDARASLERLTRRP
jgi:RNA polymerase sigma factor (sigma-70 family)